MTRPGIEHDTSAQSSPVDVARRGLLRVGSAAVAAGAVAAVVSARSVTPAAADDSTDPDRQAARVRFQRGVSVDDYGAVGDGTTNDHTAIQKAIDAGTAAGVPVRFTAGKTYVADAVLSVTGPATLSGYGATLRATGGSTPTPDYLDRSAFRTHGSHVTIEGLTIVGNGGQAYVGGMRGINSNGTAEESCVDCHIRDVTIRDMGDIAICTEWWIDSTIIGCVLSELGYAGVIVMSPNRVTIDRVVVENVHQDTTPQSYGISVTDRVNTDEGRATDVTVSNCLVRNVSQWTGISTHGGNRITFAHNRVLGCNRGIVYGAGNPSRGVTATDGIVIGNVIDGDGDEDGAGASVALAVIGQSTGAESTAYKSANIVKNHVRLIEATTNGVWLDEQ